VTRWFTQERLGWLIQLRWVALAGIALASVVAAAGVVPGVHLPTLVGTLIVASAYNLLLRRAHVRGTAAIGPRAAVAQALADFLILTVVLAAAGGIHCPFIGYYIFHVALAGILAGPRATGVAAAFALGCASLLWWVDVQPILQLGVWDPVGVWKPVIDALAFASTLAAVAYLVTHAVGELRDRERSLAQARHAERLEYEILSKTLDELDAGLEVIDSGQAVLWRNRVARELSVKTDDGFRCVGAGSGDACDREGSEGCPLHVALEEGERSRCRFSVQREGAERLYELHCFPLSSQPGEPPRVMNLYLDRTGATLAERQLVLAERLASLGRVVQGVAHELNTPLATIQTLATDMGVALEEAGSETAGGASTLSSGLVSDVGESAALIREETERLGRITQALLAGGDLVRSRVSGDVPLSAVVERASALVFAGAREGSAVRIDPSIDGVQVVADPDRLIQVLVNLLSNAHDAVHESGGGEVVVRARPMPDGLVEIAVEDDGPGIDPSIEGRIFEPFATTKPLGKGTGLGLYTSYMLVRAMRGTLELARRPEGGTRARLELPGPARLTQLSTVEPTEAAQ